MCMKELKLGREHFETLDDGDCHANTFWKKWNSEFDINTNDMTQFYFCVQPDDDAFKLPFTIEKYLQK